MSESLLSGFVHEVEASGLNMHGITVLQNGELADEYHWNAIMRRNLYSVSKSITSLGVGIAIEEGVISLDGRVADVLSDMVPEDTPQDEKLSALTLKHLLTMSSGHAKEVNPRLTGDAVRYFLNVPQAYAPGGHFVYNNGCTFMVSAMLQRLTGETLLDYLMPRLFQPLGIERPRWDQTTAGITHGFSDLYLSVPEMAKIGQLCLQKGMWEGKQLVPAQYIQAASKRQIHTTHELEDYALGYGYQFWCCKEDGVYRADGKWGQFIIVAPDKQAVIAMQSNENHAQHILGVFWDELYPLL